MELSSARIELQSCLYFLEQDLDGNAVALGLATSPGPDWLKDVVASLGLRLKVHQALRALCTDCQVEHVAHPQEVRS